MLQAFDMFIIMPSGMAEDTVHFIKYVNVQF